MLTNPVFGRAPALWLPAKPCLLRAEKAVTAYCCCAGTAYAACPHLPGATAVSICAGVCLAVPNWVLLADNSSSLILHPLGCVRSNTMGLPASDFCRVSVIQADGG